MGTAMASESFDDSHRAFDTVLKEFTFENEKQVWVNYSKLKNKQNKLASYLNALGAVSKKNYDELSREQKLAFLINAYNAFTIQLVLDHYPLKSLRDIGFFPLAAWRKDIVRLWGDEISLNDVRDLLRSDDFKEPRIHFAINCASISCPNLRREAYRADSIVKQLEEQEKQFFSDLTKNRFDNKSGVLHLSKIFKWYEEDFTKVHGSLVNYLKTVIPIDNSKRPNFNFLEYNWSLNDQKGD